MALTDSLRILITANGAQAEREFQKVGAAARTNLGHAENSTVRFGRSLTSAGVAMAAFGGVALVGLYKAAQAAQEEERAILALNNSIANSPELAGATSDAFLDLAASMQDTTTFTDDAVISAEAMLGTFHLTQQEILGLTPLVADLAAKFDLDLNRASILVGKAMDGNIGTLQRMGVRIDATAYATDRYSAVVSALRENAGGFAEQEGRTFNGQIQIMKNNLGDIAEGIGQGAVSAFNDMLGPVKSLSNAFQDLSPATQATIGRVATFGATGLVVAGTASFLAGQLLTGIARFKELAAAARTARASMAGVGLGIAGVVAGLALWADSQSDFNADFDISGLLDLNREAMDEYAIVFQELAERTGEGGTALEQFTTLAETNIEAATRFGASWGRAGGPILEINRILAEAGEASELAALGLDESATSAEEAAARFDQLAAAMNAYLDTTLGVEAAQLSQQAGLDDLRESLTENRGAWDLNTEAGRANIAAGQDVVRQAAAVVDAAREEAQATGNYTAAQRTANGAMQSAIGQLRQMKNDGLLSASAYRTLRDRIMGIPHGIPGADGIINELNQIYSAAISAANAIGQVGGSLAGGGSYGGGRSANRSGESGGTEELGRSIARELSKTTLGVVVVG